MCVHTALRLHAHARALIARRRHELRRYVQLPAAGRELACVAGEVCDDLPQARLVAQYHPVALGMLLHVCLDRGGGLAHRIVCGASRDVVDHGIELDDEFQMARVGGHAQGDEEGAHDLVERVWLECPLEGASQSAAKNSTLDTDSNRPLSIRLLIQ